MTDFDDVDPTLWQTDGVLLAQPSRARGSRRRIGRDCTYVVAASFALGVYLHSILMHGGAFDRAVAEGASAFEFESSSDPDAVPDGYWQGLLSRLSDLPSVAESDDVDPEPFV